MKTKYYWSLRSSKNTIYGLCTKHNHATDPADYRSEHEHNLMNKYARLIKQRIESNYILDKHYKIMSNGIYWPINH